MTPDSTGRHHLSSFKISVHNLHHIISFYKKKTWICIVGETISGEVSILGSHHLVKVRFTLPINPQTLPNQCHLNLSVQGLSPVLPPTLKLSSHLHRLSTEHRTIQNSAQIPLVFYCLLFSLILLFA